MSDTPRTDVEVFIASGGQRVAPLPFTEELERELNAANARLAQIEKGEPVAWRYRVNGVHTLYSSSPVPDDAYDEGTLLPLYARPSSGVCVPAQLLYDIISNAATGYPDWATLDGCIRSALAVAKQEAK